MYGQGKNFKKAKGYAPHPYYPGVTVAEEYSAERRKYMSEGEMDRRDIMAAFRSTADPKTGEELSERKVLVGVSRPLDEVVSSVGYTVFLMTSEDVEVYVALVSMPKRMQ